MDNAKLFLECYSVNMCDCHV